MAENKTIATTSSVDAYIEAISDETRRKDCSTLAKLMARATKHKSVMWGTSIVGFGSCHYKRACLNFQRRARHEEAGATDTRLP
jgi:hypothetical protein